MADFNMHNKVPYNVVVPEFGPEREAPIYPQITRKYYCQEDLAGKSNQWGRLTWKIQQPDRSMVWSSVKLVMPMKIKTKDIDGYYLDMRATQGGPACNIALSESPMNCFRQTTMSINGKTFMEDNVFRRTLNTCYRGIGPQSYGDNHSLKPIVNRTLKHRDHSTYPVVDDAGNPVVDRNVSIVSDQAIDNAFNLLEHNAPFLERARLWQDNLSYDGYTWKGDVASYLELGPFQARARKSNTAVPYIQDFFLSLQFDANPSRFDGQIGLAAGLKQEERVVACKLLEFATAPVIKHHSESLNIIAGNWPAAFKCTYTQKPYLEITYVKFPKMQPYYNLRCFEHQYEYSHDFVLEAPDGNSFDMDPVTQRVTTELLAYPTKIYLWADAARAFKDSFISGGMRRSCAISNIHCRINQRPDVLFSPSQEQCFEMFQRHTNSSLEYGTWLKSPIYCFDPVDLAQSDMLSNDARRFIMEWDCGVALTNLQQQEQRDSLLGSALECAGYNIAPNVVGESQELDEPWPGLWNFYAATDGLEAAQYGTDAGIINIQFRAAPAARAIFNGSELPQFCQQPGIDVFGKGAKFMASKMLKFMPTAPAGVVASTQPVAAQETFRINQCVDASYTIDGCCWVKMKRIVGAQNQPAKWDMGANLFYVPRSYKFKPTAAYNSYSPVLLPWEFIQETAGPPVDGDPSYNYKLKASLYAPSIKDAVPSISFRIAQGADAGKLFNSQGDDLSDTGLALAFPGPVAWVTDAKGIRNDGASTVNRRGIMKAGEKVYTGCVQNVPLNAGQTNACEYWMPILSPPEWYVDAPTAGNRYLMWRGTGSSFLADTLVDRWCGNSAPFTIHTMCAVERFVGPGDEVDPDTQEAALTATGNPPGYREGTPALFVQGYDLSYVGFSKAIVPQSLLPQYSLKVLYEYGNAQYQFAQDGMPVKVLPNLVAVQDSPLIPRL